MWWPKLRQYPAERLAFAAEEKVAVAKRRPMERAAAAKHRTVQMRVWHVSSMEVPEARRGVRRSIEDVLKPPSLQGWLGALSTRGVSSRELLQCVVLLKQAWLPLLCCRWPRAELRGEPLLERSFGVNTWRGREAKRLRTRRAAHIDPADITGCLSP